MNIYPSFKCNMKCNFCSLHDLPGDPIELSWLKTQLKEHPILCKDINILGGEPSILPLEYQEELVSICTEAANEKPYYITNLLIISPVLKKTRPIISYDWNMRPHNSKVLSNMLSLDMPFAMSTILSDCLIEKGSKYFLSFINHIPNLIRVDLILYRGGLTKIDNTPDHNKLIDFVKDVLDNPKVNLTPLSSMKKYIDNSFDNISGRLGFLPNNKYGVRIDYNHIGYTPFNTYEEAISYYYKRIKEIKNSEPCKNCEFFGRCWCIGGFEKDVCHGDKEMMELFKNVCKSI